ncbi:MAG: Ldh family oxidoreductase [Christensenellales bacterium]|jgi:LDH2 family malate/lactate/ureidoglycolate dehydrogenase
MHTSCRKLTDYCRSVLIACGVSEVDAQVTAQVLVNADMRSIHSHGVIRMIGYVDCLLSGGVRADAMPRVIIESASNALVDADQGLGISASVFATEIARKKAMETGMGLVNVFNSHHHGACGYYSQSLTESGLIGFAMSTGDVIMAASGSASRSIGNNPFSYAIPAGKYRAICYDVAMSMVAAGKISIAADENQTIPLGWLLDPEGNPTTDPKDYDRGGALVPFGGHKGFGLSMMVESLAGLLSGAAMLSDIHAWNQNPNQSGNVGHFIVALDPRKLNPNVDMVARVEAMIEELAASPRAPGIDRILYPGQLEHEHEALASKEGLKLPPATQDALKKVAQRISLPFNPGKMI